MKQLETALEALGHFEGTPDEDYDAMTETAVVSLYVSLGYSPAESDDSGLNSAQLEVDAAEAALAAAEAARDAADADPSQGEIMAAEAAVTTAEQNLVDAEAGGDAGAIAVAAAEVQLAKEYLGELLNPSDLSEFDAVIEAAQDDLDRAERSRDELATGSGVTVPRGEMVSVPALPRQIGTVTASIGQTPAGEAFTLVGATTEVTMQVTRKEAELVAVGHTVELFSRPTTSTPQAL